MKRLENINKAENKYWKNTSNLIKDDKVVVRNKSARERLGIRSGDGVKVMK